MWLEHLLQDLNFGLRTLRKNPGFAATAVLTLALATGATTAIFSILNSVLLEPLPFSEPERLVQVYGRVWSGIPGDPVNPVAQELGRAIGSLQLDAFQKEATSFAGFAGYALTTTHLEGRAGPERMTTVAADLAFFSLLGVEPIAGRTFRSDDSVDVAVISAHLWHRRFGSDSTLAGRTIALDGRPFTVVGIMPEWFQFPYGAASLMPAALPESRTDLWIPLEPLQTSSGAPLRRGRVSVIARLQPGARLEAAAAELSVLVARLEEPTRGVNPGPGAALVPLADEVIGPVRRSLWMLFAAAGLVLATACANVANLLLARVSVRAREVLTRAALGANRLRLIRQFLAESLLLSFAGGLAGALIARWGTNLLVVLGSAKIPRAHEIALDWQAFGFLLTACLATAVVFGLAPALTAARVDLPLVTREGTHATMGRGYGRLRDSLAAVEIALAFVLAMGAALLMREVIRLQNADTGMVTENVLSLHLTPRAPARDYYDIEARVAGLPGVTAAGFTQLVPLQNWGWEADFAIRGRPRVGRPQAALRYVTPGYFSALGIPIVRGRALSVQDHADAPRVVLVNDALARRYFPGEDPIGQELDRGTIVGVVGNVRQAGLDKPADPELYYPAAQNVTMASDIGMSLMVRTEIPPHGVVDAVRTAVRQVNPNVAIFNVRTMDQVVADSLWELNLYRWLIGMFAALALVLAAIGLYGVIAYSVVTRAREFAIRLALGSTPSTLARLIVGRGLAVAAAGLLAGALIAIAAMTLVSDLPAFAPDPWMFAMVSTLLLAITGLACLAPALAVAHTDPVKTLRHD